MSFLNFDLDERIINSLNLISINSPNKLQSISIGKIKSSKDNIFFKSPTGSGKTLSYLIPIMDRVLKRSEKFLILLPTNDLSKQVFNLLSSFNFIKSSVLVGSRREIDFNLEDFDILVGTPDKVEKELNSLNLNSSFFNSIVIDEADLVFNDFEGSSLKKIFKYFNKSSFFLFSATSNFKLDSFISNFNFEVIDLLEANLEEFEVLDYAMFVLSKNKLNLLGSILNDRKFKKVLIFVEKKVDADNLKRALLENFSIKAEVLHSSKSSAHRDKVIKNFKSFTNRVLISTDIVSRGFDIGNIDHVISFSPPKNFDIFIHRRGRLTRGSLIDKRNIVFFTEKDLKIAKLFFNKFDLKIINHQYSLDLKNYGFKF